jgi:hypothetical protein
METLQPTTRWTVTASFLGLVVTLSVGMLTWYASYLATQQSATESCIQRVDKQEALIREKAEQVLASIAALGTKTSAPDLTEEKFHVLGEGVADSAMRFTAYAPKELAAVTFNLIGTIQLGLMAETVEQKLRAINLAQSAMKDWPSQYYGLMDKYDQRRSACLN